jgi:hypothetical protein
LVSFVRALVHMLQQLSFLLTNRESSIHCGQMYGLEERICLS